MCYPLLYNIGDFKNTGKPQACQTIHKVCLALNNFSWHNKSLIFFFAEMHIGDSLPRWK